MWEITDYFGGGRPKITVCWAPSAKEAVRKYVNRHHDDSWDLSTVHGRTEMQKAIVAMQKKLKHVRYGDYDFYDTYLPTGDWCLRLRHR